MPRHSNPFGEHEVAAHYRQATGIPCRVLDLNKPACEGDVCPGCVLGMGVTGSTVAQCQALHQSSARLARRFGGSYVYFCRCSLMFWISPVLLDGRMDKAILAGPVLVLEPQDMQAELDEDLSCSEALKHLVRIPIQRVHSLQEVLRMCAAWVSGYAEHSMVESRLALDQQSQLSEYIQELKEREESTLSHPGSQILEQEARLQEAIRWGERERSQQALNELLGSIFFSEGNSLERIRYRVMQLVLIISRSAIQGGADEEAIVAATVRSQRELARLRDQDELAAWLSALLHRFSQLVFDSSDHAYGPVLARAMRHIAQRFESKVTLQETATAACVSPTHLSRLFNTKMGLPFSDAVNRFRIEKSYRLLVETALPINEVAELSGFSDQSYFSKVFKRFAHMSPTEFRSNGRLYPSDTAEVHESL